MNTPESLVQSGRVASLHLHPAQPGAPLRNVETIEVVEAKGVMDDSRYFGRLSRDTGKPSRRQVTLIAREQIADHAAALELKSIPPGVVRANIETIGINLLDLVGRHVRIGRAVLLIYEPRMPCEKMDAVCKGLRERMKSNRQGVLAEVVQSGTIRIGDTIQAGGDTGSSSGSV